jgi:cyanate lyase
MNERPTLDTDILRTYFNKTEYQDERYSISIKLISDVEHYGFEVSIEIKEPNTQGAYPQRRLALEQHSLTGHEGVHVQIKYHLIENDLNIGQLHIMIDCKNDEDLLEIGEGFVYTLYEIVSSFGSALENVIPELFKIELLEDIKDKKIILIEKIKESLENRVIEVRNLAKEVTLIKPEDLRSLLKTRRELRPLLETALD